ncbi:glycosyl transferase, group 1 family protein [Thermosipho africanus TCF52B]|uniref:Glycosyl transferase, group 1 family protein n=1 Tax=Thermosipho africanus (strain TCF52B) TaxID=484019 RepID=B7IGX6_THEAB|nr:glycosyltransferase [Thermosipho africanus]ACJ75340.1 glycosyl transferase, group 1 family protein [Thermosipho africanus TCF52B]
MKILVIGYMHSKEDKRVFRTVETLSRKHKIIYQYLTKDDEKSYTENSITYVPIKYELNKTNYLIEFKNRTNLDKKILKMVENFEYDIIYFHHFLPTRPLKPFKIAKKRGKIIIYDIHEYHPENFLNSLNGMVKVLKEKIMWKIFEKQIMLSNKLVFVSKETQEDIYKKLNVNTPYLIVPNYASISIEPDEKRKEISLVGKITRNIENEKEIIKKLIEKGFKFKIIGMESDAFKDIPHEYTSFLPYEDMMVELSKSAFSLISYNTVKNENYKNDLFALPHKYYDSIAAGTPVIVKNTFLSMTKEVEKYGIGIVINPKNVEESVDKIIKAYENYNILQENIKKYKHLFVWDKDKENEFLNFILKE